jgi:hypothetical protein
VGVEFVAVDTIHILAAVAEHEREAISEGTKAALAAAKARNEMRPIPPAPWSTCARPARRRQYSLLPTCCRSSEISGSVTLTDHMIGRRGPGTSYGSWNR